MDLYIGTRMNPVKILCIWQDYIIFRNQVQCHLFFILIQGRVRGYWICVLLRVERVHKLQDECREGVYLMDEPEAALSPQRQLTLMRQIYYMAMEGSQFIIATHSPLLLSLDGAKIYDLDENPVEVRDWWNLETVRLYQQFFETHKALF